MKKLSSLIVVLLIVMAWSLAAGAATYYVAPNGSDSASGSLSSPWKTPGKAASTADPGDVIYLRAGTYRVAGRTGAFVNFSRSGTSASPITLAGYPGETAILNGMVDRSQPSLWTLSSGNIYYTENLSTSDIYVVVQDDTALEPRSSLASLDGPGKTYFDNAAGRLYVWARGGGNPGSFRLEISQTDCIVRYDASDRYMVLENLTLTGAYYGIQCSPNGAHRTFRKLILKHFEADAIKFNTTGNTEDLIEYCRFSSFGDFGIDSYGSSYQTFRYNDFTGVHPWMSGGAIKSLADGKYHLIEGNYIHDLGGLGYEGALELREAEYIQVVNNLIVNVTGGGVSLYGDNSTITTPVPDPTVVGVTIANNTFYKTKTPAIYLIQDCQAITVENNIVMQPSGNSSCLRVNSGTETGFVSNHNDFFRIGGSPVRWLGNEYTLAQYQSTTRQDLASIASDPLFVNAAGGDFHLKSGSPACERGDASVAPALDMEGIARPQGAGIDLGAYELAAPSAPAVTSFAINNGAASTTNQVVTLNNTCQNSPTHYMASENPAFTGAIWQPYAQAPSFTLSSGTGTKVVYFKVESGAGESAVLSDSIVLSAPVDTTPPSILIVTPQSGGEYTTNSPTVDIAGTASDNTGVTLVTWNTDRGESGTATGTSNWRIDRLPLQEGDNLVTVTARDASGNQDAATLMVVYGPDQPGDPITIQLQVSAGADDSTERISDGANYSSLNDVYLGANAISAFRFRAVQIPQSAIITEARLWLNCRYDSGQSISVRYVGQAVDNAPAFSASQYNISSRTQTSDAVTHTPSGWTTGQYTAGPDISAIIQEIVDQPEWQQGNALALFIYNNGSAATRRVYSYERSTTRTAKLVITYYQP